MLENKPKQDLVFKTLFGNEKDKRLLIEFLQILLKIPPEEFDEVLIMNPTDTIAYKGQKSSTLDIKLQLKSKRLLNIEIQTGKKAYFGNRSLFNACKLVTEQVKSGDENYILSDVIVILICDFIHKRELQGYHNVARMTFEGTEVAFSKALTVHLLELPRLPKEQDGSIL